MMEDKNEINKAYETIDDFRDKLGEMFYDEFEKDDNTCLDMAKGIIHAFNCCKTERDFEIADMMLIGIGGWSIKTLISKIEKRDYEGYVWESC